MRGRDGCRGARAGDGEDAHRRGQRGGRRPAGSGRGLQRVRRRELVGVRRERARCRLSGRGRACPQGGVGRAVAEGKPRGPAAALRRRAAPQGRLAGSAGRGQGRPAPAGNGARRARLVRRRHAWTRGLSPPLSARGVALRAQFRGRRDAHARSAPRPHGTLCRARARPRRAPRRDHAPHARPLQRGAGSPRLPTHVERGRAGAWGRGGAAATGDSRGAARLSPSVASPERSRIIARQLMGKDIELAILFADVVGSTRLYDTMGDLRARDMVAICIDVMRGATEQRQGTVIKTMGDEVMATFPTADAALNAAAQMQQQISTYAYLHCDGRPVAIRIGCHYGPVMLEIRDVFVAAVHIANRMTSQAKAGQIVTTAATVEKLSPEWRASCRQIDVATLKGQGSEVALYEVLWQTEDVTSMVPGIATEPRSGHHLRLRLQWQDRELLVDERHSSVTIGRAEDNDMVVKGNLISRLHARIEISRNKFVLIDQSTHATLLQSADGAESLVRRDSLQIKGQGMIGLGRLPERGSPQTIGYACEEA